MASNASRYLFLFLIGLVVGVVGTVMAMRALDARQDHFPTSVMQVQQGVGRDEHEVEGAPQVEVPHVAVHPLHRYSALIRLAASLCEHLR